MKSNSIVMAFLLALAALAAAQASMTTYTLGGQLVLNVTKYYPYPAEPGNYIDLWFDVINDGPDAANNVTCEFVAAYPFSLNPGDSASQYVRQLQGRQGWLLKYKVLVDPAAVEGDNDAKVRCRTPATDWIENKISVSVRSPQAILEVGSIVVEPETAKPAGRVAVRFTVENKGDSAVKDLSAKIDVSGQDIPLAVVQSGAEKRLRELLPGENSTVGVELAVLSNAEPKIYKVPLVLSWSSTLGSAYSKTEYIALTIGQQPQLTVGLDSTDIVLPGKNGRVVIRVANAGPAAAKFVRVSLQPDGYQLITSGESYIGNIDPDGVETAEFKLAADAGASELPIRMLVAYEDANGQSYTDSREVRVKLYTEEEAYRLGLLPRADYTILYALAALVALYLLYRAANWALRRRR